MAQLLKHWMYKSKDQLEFGSPEPIYVLSRQGGLPLAPALEDGHTEQAG